MVYKWAVVTCSKSCIARVALNSRLVHVLYEERQSVYAKEVIPGRERERRVGLHVAVLFVLLYRSISYLSGWLERFLTSFFFVLFLTSFKAYSRWLFVAFLSTEALKYLYHQSYSITTLLAQVIELYIACVF